MVPFGSTSMTRLPNVSAISVLPFGRRSAS
jgi:hypothetical protein